MKKRLLAVTSVMLVCCMLLAAFPVAAATVESNNVGASSGTTGSCTWTLDDNGTLTISGNGKMGDYEYNTKPWGYNVKNVIIEGYVTTNS